MEHFVQSTSDTIDDSALGEVVAEIRRVMDGRTLFRIIVQAVTGRVSLKWVVCGPGCIMLLSAPTLT